MYQYRLSTLMLLMNGLAVLLALPYIVGAHPGSWHVTLLLAAALLGFWSMLVGFVVKITNSGTRGAVLRYFTGVVASGSLFPSVMLLLTVLFARNAGEGEIQMLVFVVFAGAVVGAILAALGALLSCPVAVVVMRGVEDRMERAMLGASLGAVVGGACFALLGWAGTGPGLFPLLVAAVCGAAGGGLPNCFTPSGSRGEAHTETKPNEQAEIGVEDRSISLAGNQPVS